MQRLTLSLLLLTSVCASCSGQIPAEPPSAVDIDLINNASRSALTNRFHRLAGSSLPEYAQTTAGKIYRFYDITIRNITLPTSNVTRHPTIPNGFMWTVRGGSITIGGSFYSSLRILGNWIRYNGAFSLTVKTMDIDVIAIQEVNGAITLGGFQCRVDVTLRFSGRGTWILNLLVNTRTVKDTVQTLSCTALKEKMENTFSEGK